MKKQIEFQAERIEAVLRLHNVSARVTGGTVTPRWIRYQVLPSPGADLSRVKLLSEELAAALDAPSCRVSWRGAAIEVQVERDNPQPVRLLQLSRYPGLEMTPPLTAILGLAHDGAPLLARLPADIVGNIQVPRSLLPTIAVSLTLRHSSPADLTLVLVGNWPNLAQLPQSVRGSDQALDGLMQLVQTRRKNGDITPPVVAVLDNDVDPSADLLTLGPPVGVHVIAAGGRGGLPFGMRVVRCNGNWVARCDGKSYSFTPAVVEFKEEVTNAAS